jgi:hypothetical protein
LGSENSEVLLPLVAVAVTFCPTGTAWPGMNEKETLPAASVLTVL